VFYFRGLVLELCVIAFKSSRKHFAAVMIYRYSLELNDAKYFRVISWLRSNWFLLQGLRTHGQQFLFILCVCMTLLTKYRNANNIQDLFTCLKLRAIHIRGFLPFKICSRVWSCVQSTCVASVPWYLGFFSNGAMNGYQLFMKGHVKLVGFIFATAPIRLSGLAFG